MARRPFGGTTADVAQDVAGDRISGAQVTVWTAATGGTKLTDLQTPAGVALTNGVVRSDTNGIIAFLGPADGTAAVYVDGGVGGRTLMVASDLPDRVALLESAPGGVTSVAGRSGAVTLAKADVGLGNVDNTADTAKPVSTAQQTALNLKANLASPALTGTPTAPTAASSDNSTTLATTAFVKTSVGSFVATIGPSNGTDDTAAIQAALTAVRLAGRGKAKGLFGSSYIYSASLILGSRTELDMEGCTLTAVAGLNAPTLRNYSAVNPVRSTTSTTTAFNALVTMASASAADVGRHVVIAGAGPGGCVHTGTVVSAVAGVSVTLDAAPHKAVTGATTTVFNVDTDITITGGDWFPGNTNGATDGPLRHHFLFRHVDGLTVRGKGSLTTTGGKYGIAPGGCSRVRLELSEWKANVSSNFVQFDGPGRDVRVIGATGLSVLDDFLAVGTGGGSGGAYDAYYDTCGSYTDVVFDSPNCTGAPTTYARIFTGDGANAPVGLTGVTLTAATDLLTKTAHGLDAGQQVIVTAITGSTGLIGSPLGPPTPYYVINPTANTFQLSTSVGGSAVNIATADGTATIIPMGYSITGLELLDFNGSGISGSPAIVIETTKNGGMINNSLLDGIGDNVRSANGTMVQVSSISDQILFRRVTSRTSTGAVFVQGWADVGLIDIDCSTHFGASTNDPFVTYAAPVDQIRIRNCKVLHRSSGYLVKRAAGGVLRKLKVLDSSLGPSGLNGGIIDLETSPASVPNVVVRGVDADGPAWSLGTYGGTTVLTVDDFTLTNPQNGLVRVTATGSLTIQGSGPVSQLSNPSIVAGGLFRVNHPNLSVDLSLVNTKVLGDRAISKTAVGTIPAGHPVIYSGTAWKSLIDGTLTY